MKKYVLTFIQYNDDGEKDSFGVIGIYPTHDAADEAMGKEEDKDLWGIDYDISLVEDFS